MPDVTVLLRIDPELAEARGQQRLAEGGADGTDRFEGEGIELQRLVAAAYDDLAARHGDRIAVVDAEEPRGEVHEEVMRNRGAGLAMNPATAAPDVLRDATENQPAARAALSAALRSPGHAYLFAGPPGSGKRAAARAFAAELLDGGAADPDDARRRALADPSPHPDLVWLAPQGTQHLVDELRERVIVAAAYRPFEGARRVFVIEAAEAMADEGQNALLKTLEEPPPFVHLVLITSEPAALLETVRSRCQPVRFAPLGAEAVEARLAELGLGTGERSAGPRRAWPAATRTERPSWSASRAVSFVPGHRRASRPRSPTSSPARPGGVCSPPRRRRASRRARRLDRGSRPWQPTPARARDRGPGAAPARPRRPPGARPAAPGPRRSTWRWP